MKAIPAYKLDWNPMTAEGYSETKNEVIMVFNFDMSTEDKVKNVVQYVVGRTIWGCKNFPLKAKIRLAFDIRGQGIIVSRSNLFKDKIFELISNLNIDNQILIEFLR